MTSAEDSWCQMAFTLGHWQLLGYGAWALEEKESDRFMGFAGLLHAPDRPCWPTLEIGWKFDKPFWGKGYATEAARTAQDYAFRETGADRVCSLILDKNLASIRIAEKLGQSYERSLPDYHEGCLVYSISREDWERLAAASSASRKL